MNSTIPDQIFPEFHSRLVIRVGIPDNSIVIRSSVVSVIDSYDDKSLFKIIDLPDSSWIDLDCSVWVAPISHEFAQNHVLAVSDTKLNNQIDF